MGFSHSWIAVKGLDRATALATLGLEADEDEADELHRRGLGALPGGWLLVVAEGDGALNGETAALAAHGPAVACFVEEHVMCSEARGYRDGREAWRVAHDPRNGIFHLEVAGEPPEALGRIRAEAVAEQEREGGEAADVDLLFDVPATLAKSLCGFKLDDEWPDGLAFAELRRPGGAGSGRPGLLRRLFGRG
jgi:hypothetical protein